MRFIVTRVPSPAALGYKLRATTAVKTGRQGETTMDMTRRSLVAGGAAVAATLMQKEVLGGWEPSER